MSTAALLPLEAVAFLVTGAVLSGALVLPAAPALAVVPIAVQWAASFLISTGAGVVSSNINRWLNGKSDQQKAAQEIVVKAGQAGLDVRYPKVFGKGSYAVVIVSDGQSSNGCAIPVTVDGVVAGMFEGPAIAGMGGMASAMQKARWTRAQISDALFPTGEHQRSSKDALSDYSKPGWVSYGTRNGINRIDYSVGANTGTSTLSLPDGQAVETKLGWQNGAKVQLI